MQSCWAVHMRYGGCALPLLAVVRGRAQRFFGPSVSYFTLVRVGVAPRTAKSVDFPSLAKKLAETGCLIDDRLAE